MALLLSLRIGTAAGTYKAGLFAALAVALLAFVANFILLKLERNYEFDAVKRRKFHAVHGLTSTEEDAFSSHDALHSRSMQAFSIDISSSPNAPHTSQKQCFTAAVSRVFRTLFGFPFGFWMLAVIGLSYYGACIVWIAFARQMFEVCFSK